MAERRSVEVHLRVSPAERAARKAKAAVGLSLSALLRQAMARTQTWTAPPMAVERERSRQIARIGNNLTSSRAGRTPTPSPIEAVRVTDRLMAVERALRVLALPGREDGGAL